MKISKMNLIGLAVALSATPALAQNKSTTTAQPWTKNLRLTLAADYFGQAVTDLGSTVQPDVDTGARDASSPIWTDFAAVGGYSLGKWTVGGAYAVKYTPVTVKATDPSVTTYDPQLRLTNGSLYSKGNYSLGTQLRVYMGLTEKSQNQNMITNLRWYQFHGLEFPGSRWSLSMVTYLRPYINGEMTPAGAKRQQFHAYAGPQVNYQINENLRAWGLFEYLASKSANSEGFVPATDLEFGASWDITKKLSFTPYIDIKTSNRIAADTTTLNANLTFVAL